MAHPYHMHREHQVSHRRVAPLLKGEPSGATQHANSDAFSKVTSKSAAASHDDGYARGGKVKHGQTNIAIVMPQNSPANKANLPAGPTGGPPGAPPMGGPPPLPGGPPGMPPPPPGMPMRASGGRIRKADGGSTPKRESEDAARTTREILERRGIVTPSRASGGRIDGDATKAGINKWSKRAKDNSYFTGGAATGVGREEKASHMKRKGK